jgi:hypothetical protein
MSPGSKAVSTWCGGDDVVPLVGGEMEGPLARIRHVGRSPRLDRLNGQSSWGPRASDEVTIPRATA